VVDGKEMGKNYNPAAIDPQKIEAIQVYKSAAALEKYGERAKGGAVEITTGKTG
jgi:bla regulator protein blaR1